MELLDRTVCHRALQTRDRRFDGRLFVGVTSTGIYCRPICPAKTARIENCRFFSTAAAAQEAGFRPCLRCRPEISPETLGWRGTSNTVSRGLRLISEGFLDEEDASIEKLADRLGVGERQLRRLFEEHVGASPLSVAQTRRVLFAKQLIHDTQLSMTEVAMASGFGSLRRFNDTFKKLYHRPPSELRRRKQVQKVASSPDSPEVSLVLSYRPPYDWERILAHLRARAIDGIEEITDGKYKRTISVQGMNGLVEVANKPERHCLEVKIHFPTLRTLSSIALRLRQLFDTQADVNLIEAHLSNDTAMAELVARHPGLRVPGAWDGFELAVRAILGQQITVRAAQQLAGKLVRLCGEPLADFNASGLGYIFPSLSRLAAADLGAIGMPNSRKNTLRRFAETVIANPNFFDASATLEETVSKLRCVPGIGEWTAHYIALRAFRETDAFPATDVVILRGATELEGAPLTTKELLHRAKRWRPWRAYAAQHLWAAGGQKQPLRFSAAGQAAVVSEPAGQHGWQQDRYL
jgi:AraC family transcriptional regulator, regulatory protein of adaptative response / DNA-3-methyladenine glycosylase II